MPVRPPAGCEPAGLWRQTRYQAFLCTGSHSCAAAVSAYAAQYPLSFRTCSQQWSSLPNRHRPVPAPPPPGSAAFYTAGCPACSNRKILAAVHNTRQCAGHRKGRQRHLFIGYQAKYRRDRLCQSLHAALRQRNVQPGQAAARLLASSILLAAAFRKLLQLAIPAVRALIIYFQSAKHAHPLHQRRGCQNSDSGRLR